VNIVLLARNFPHAASWRRVVAAFAERATIVADGDLPPKAIEGALVYDPAPNRSRVFPNLRVIFRLTAGVERLVAESTLPDIPLVPLVSPEMTALMAEYVTYHAIRIRRDFAHVEAQIAERQWQWAPPASPPGMCRVGVLGLGRLGAGCARALRALSFDVWGGSQTLKKIEGIRCCAGESGLHAVLAGTEILACLLPLTPATRGLLAAPLFRRLKPATSLINVSRGECLCEQDLLRAFEDGQIAHATLDTLTTEPLPSDHPFWTHARLTITPHLAADPPLETSLAELSRHVQRLMEGRPLDGVVDRGRGY
jgi:glyoxylate/hydroxypyruvate reductase A